MRERERERESKSKTDSRRDTYHIMGAKLSLEHDPDQLEAVRIAEKKVLEYFQAPNPRDVWLELPTSMDDNNNNNENDNNKLCGHYLS